jgi:hypothetical protein
MLKKITLLLTAFASLIMATTVHAHEPKDPNNYWQNGGHRVPGYTLEGDPIPHYYYHHYYHHYYRH